MRLNRVEVTPDNIYMGNTFYNLLKKHIEDKGFTFHTLQFKVEITSSEISRWNKPKEEGGRLPSDTHIQKLAAFKELELSEDTLKGWRALDEYSKEQIFIALDALPEKEVLEALQNRLGAKITKQD
jgi:hypothetical protein